MIHYLVSQHHGEGPLKGGLRELLSPQHVDPGGLPAGVVPEDVVASDGDVAPCGEFEKRVGWGVVGAATGWLRGVPFHLVLEGGDGEAGPPRVEPRLVGGVAEDVGVYGAAEGEGWPLLLE